MKKTSSFMSKYFLVIAILVGILSFIFPPSFSWVGRLGLVPWILGLIMFSMGLTTQISDFKNILYHPKSLIIGVIAVFTVSPIITFAMIKVFNVPEAFAIGLMLVAACPGGTTSNVFTMLSKGDTPLSIGMTFVETIAAVFITPALVYLFFRTSTEVNAVGMMISVFQIVVLPVVLGIVFKTMFKKLSDKMQDGVPTISITFVILLLGNVVAANAGKEELFTSGLNVLIPSILFIPLTLIVGYYIAKLIRVNVPQSKAIAIEIGFKNSNLGITLAMLHFADMPLAAIPGAIIVIMTNIMGPIVASIWSRTKDTKKSKSETEG